MAFQGDERDRQILNFLSRDAWLTYSALAKLVNLSPSAVQRRVERLIKQGVLTGARAQVSEAAKQGLMVYFLAELIDDSARTLAEFSAEILSAPEVDEAHYVTGEADVIVKLCLKDMAHYDRFIATHVNKRSIVRRFKSLTSLRTLL